MEGLELARKHFATALKLNPDNVRALYGLCWVSRACYDLVCECPMSCDWCCRCAMPSTVVAVRQT